MAIDGRALGTAEDTGIGRYIHALVAALREGHGVSTALYRQEFPRLVGPQLALGLRMRLGGAAVIHGPANALPLARYGLPGVVTVHDLAIYDHPEWFPRGQWFATRVVVPRSIRSATVVICPSQATAEAVARLMGVGVDRCRVIPHGVEPDFALPVAGEIRAETRSRYALPERYILQVGTVQPRKNYIASLRALARIPAAERIPLLVAGGLGWDYEPVIRTVERLGLRSWVRFLGYVGFRDLPALYQMAQAVAFPSYEEGFGLPILEAFAAGVPVAASTAGAIPEVAADAALLCAPDDEAALAQNLLALISDEPLRQRQIAAGRVRAAGYTWSACAAAHGQVYRDAAAA
ncbi:MAG TPA: glycosyltransferase family 1 protein [Candidatus Dormibacteraeota bacterium]|nr:glycosyltransferase family 1 protein [Candidatus Dormibacteraeota bacterium]